MAVSKAKMKVVVFSAKSYDRIYLDHSNSETILRRCAGFNPVDLALAQELGLFVANVPTYSPEAGSRVRSHPHQTLNCHTHRAYYRANDHSGEVIIDVLTRLMTFPNVIISTHQAFFTEEALTEIAKSTLGNLSDSVAKRSGPDSLLSEGHILVREDRTPVRL